MPRIVYDLELHPEAANDIRPDGYKGRCGFELCIRLVSYSGGDSLYLTNKERGDLESKCARIDATTPRGEAWPLVFGSADVPVFLRRPHDASGAAVPQLATFECFVRRVSV